MTTYLIPVIAIAIALSIVHIIGEWLSERIERFHFRLLSLGAGLFVGGIFLEIMPHIALGEEHLDHYIYLIFLTGFVLIHVLEKFLIQHASGDSELMADMVSFRTSGVVAYLLLVGVIIAIFIETSADRALFIIIPLFVRDFALSLSLMHTIERMSKPLRVLLFISPPIGALIGLALASTEAQLFALLAFASGVILYIAIRDLIPFGRTGKPIYFVAGTIIATLAFLLQN